MINKEHFQEAKEKVLNTEQNRGGIGTLGERSLHAVLKHYYEPHEENHEIKIGGYVADIVGENGIIEIQTRNFYALKKKLANFLEAGRVSVVYPVAAIKWTAWINPETGEKTKPRRSSKKGTPYQVFGELVFIKELFENENLTFIIVMLEIEEHRLLNGWSRDKKRGSERVERYPIDIVDEIIISNKADYNQLIPPNLPIQFTAKDYKKESGLNLKNAQIALNILNKIGAVTFAGKNGRAYLYEKIP